MTDAPRPGFATFSSVATGPGNTRGRGLFPGKEALAVIGAASASAAFYHGAVRPRGGLCSPCTRGRAFPEGGDLLAAARVAEAGLGSTSGRGLKTCGLIPFTGSLCSRPGAWPRSLSSPTQGSSAGVTLTPGLTGIPAPGLAQGLLFRIVGAPSPPPRAPRGRLWALASRLRAVPGRASERGHCLPSGAPPDLPLRPLGQAHDLWRGLHSRLPGDMASLARSLGALTGEDPGHSG